MNLALLTKYDVKFHRDLLAGRNTAYGGGLAYFLDNLNDLDNVIDGSKKVDLYLNGGTGPLGDNAIKGEVYTAYLDQDSADIYFDLDTDPNNVLQIIPLSDFRTILELWMDFIKKSKS